MTLLLTAGLAYAVRMVTRTRLPIRVAEVQMGEIVSTISTNGIVEPQSNFEAHAPYSGLVKAVFAREGERVAAGKLLVAMDNTEAHTRLASALTALRGAEANYEAFTKGGTQQERYALAGDVGRAQADHDQAEHQLGTLKRLAAEGSASASEVAAAQQRLDQTTASLHLFDQRRTSPYTAADLEHAKAELADAQSVYRSAQSTLEQANVRAPFAGTVYSLPVSPTEYVQPGDRLLEMADLTKMQVRAYFDEPDIGQLAIGLPVTIVWDAMPGRPWKGHIIRLPSTVITYTTRHVGAALLTVDNADGRLLPDTNVTVTVTTNSTPGILSIPREALHTVGGQSFVFLLDGEKLKRVPVRVGVNNLTAIQVVSGLKEGQVVSVGTANGQPVVDGVPVKVVR